MGSIIDPLIRLIFFAVRIYTFIIIARAVISWVQPNPYNQIVQMLYKVTEPVLFPIRKAIAKRLGNIGIDLSPIVAIVLLNVIANVFVRWVLVPLA